MRDILIASYDLEVGGVERSLISMLNNFDYDNNKVDLMLYSHTGEFMDLIPKSPNLLDENKKYKPSIVLENNTEDIKNNILNKIVLKNEGNNIEDMFTKEIKNTNEGITGSDKSYEIYYKK